MNPEPESRHYDRYKARSLKAYNSKMVERYDSLFWHRVLKTNAWDEEILAEMGSEIASLRVLDIGCATGRLLSHLAKAGAKHLYGTDLAPNILKVARRKLAGSEAKVELKPADAEVRRAPGRETEKPALPCCESGGWLPGINSWVNSKKEGRLEK